MKIAKYQDKDRSIPAREADLLAILSQPSDSNKRPCVSCDKSCSCQKRSNHCCCDCSPQCPDAPFALSSEPDRYPIEPYVVPMVYALSVLRVTPPCWSCEGHARDDGKLLRLPQVWFYSASAVYPELIAEYISDLMIKKKLSHAWQVSLCPHTEGGATVFQIRPDRPNESDMQENTFSLLQKDLLVIAESMRNSVLKLAKRKLDEIQAQR